MSSLIFLPVISRSREDLIDKISAILDASNEICEQTAELIIARVRSLPFEEVESIADTLQWRIHDAICQSFADEVSRSTCVLPENLRVV